MSNLKLAARQRAGVDPSGAPPGGGREPAEADARPQRRDRRERIPLAVETATVRIDRKRIGQRGWDGGATGIQQLTGRVSRHTSDRKGQGSGNQ